MIITVTEFKAHLGKYLSMLDDADEEIFITRYGKIIAKISGTSENIIEDSEEFIGLEAAKKIALEKAALPISQVVFQKTELDEDDGVVIYEIEFECQGQEYEVEIDATTGEIIDFEIDD